MFFRIVNFRFRVYDEKSKISQRAANIFTDFYFSVFNDFFLCKYFFHQPIQL